MSSNSFTPKSKENLIDFHVTHFCSASFVKHSGIEFNENLPTDLVALNTYVTDGGSLDKAFFFVLPEEGL